MRISKTFAVALALVACGMSSVASAQASATDPLGFYVGAGAGPSQIRSNPNYNCCSYYGDYNYTFAWQGIVGIRPVRALGLEAEYIDFGTPGNGYYYHAPDSSGGSHPTAPALFAVGYLPIPLPYLDIFAKAGGARLSTRVTTYSSQPCVAGGPCPDYVPSGNQEVIDTKFAYGAGVQSRLPLGLILRGEYERVASQYGDPSAFMFSALFSF
jgi:hypothetical protein